MRHGDISSSNDAVGVAAKRVSARPRTEVEQVEQLGPRRGRQVARAAQREAVRPAAASVERRRRVVVREDVADRRRAHRADRRDDGRRRVEHGRVQSGRVKRVHVGRRRAVACAGLFETASINTAAFSNPPGRRTDPRRTRPSISSSARAVAVRGRHDGPAERARPGLGRADADAAAAPARATELGALDARVILLKATGGF